MNEALNRLLQHPDPSVRRDAEVINVALKRRKYVLKLIQEALAQLRLDMKYMHFDLECTRRERDELRASQ